MTDHISLPAVIVLSPEVAEKISAILAEHVGGHVTLMPPALALPDRELAAVLAGLRLLQCGYVASGDPDDQAGIELIASNNGALVPLDDDEIDALCERLNSGGMVTSITDELATALRDLLNVIQTDNLIPESISYMRQARAALAKAGG
ncbi:MAG: hypothetical protein AB7H90_01330 [Alphaproteobacteria bacterium]